MFVMQTVSHHTQPSNDCRPGTIVDGVFEPEDIATLKARRLQELARLRDIGMRKSDDIGRWLDGDITADESKKLLGKGGIVMEFTRVSRAVRQIITLEMEICGLKDGPDRDGWSSVKKNASEEKDAPDLERFGALTFHEVGDYDNRPLDQVVASLRKTLNAEAPPRDPFAPPVERAAPPTSDAAADDVTCSDEIESPNGRIAAETLPQGADFGVWTETRERVSERSSVEMAVRSRGPPG